MAARQTCKLLPLIKDIFYAWLKVFPSSDLELVAENFSSNKENHVNYTKFCKLLQSFEQGKTSSSSHSKEARRRSSNSGTPADSKSPGKSDLLENRAANEDAKPVGKNRRRSSNSKKNRRSEDEFDVTKRKIRGDERLEKHCLLKVKFVTFGNHFFLISLNPGIAINTEKDITWRQKL